MDKTALEIDPRTVGRHAAGGALVGASAASVVNLVHHINMMREERKRRKEPSETDENTIVLTLPKKAASFDELKQALKLRRKQAEIAGDTKVKNFADTKTGDFLVRGNGSQSRSTPSGKFGPRLVNKPMDGEKQAGSGWPTLTASALAALGGGVGGAMLTNKLYQAYRERQLKQDLEAAKQEYMDALQGGVKGAEYLDALCTEATQEKEADTFGTLNYPLAAAAIMTILGSGATGYITKRVLDEKFKEVDDKSLQDMPKVKRIVFKSAEETDPEKLASADDIDCLKGGLMVMMDRVSGTVKYSSAAPVKAELDKLSMTPDALVKLADNWDNLMQQLEGAPDLRKSIAGVANEYMTKNPIARFANGIALKTPWGQQYADKMLFGKLREMRGGARDMAQQSVSDVVTAADKAWDGLKGGGRTVYRKGMELANRLIPYTAAPMTPRMFRPKSRPLPWQSQPPELNGGIGTGAPTPSGPVPYGMYGTGIGRDSYRGGAGFDGRGGLWLGKQGQAAGIGKSMLALGGYGAVKDVLEEPGMSQEQLADLIVRAQEAAKERKQMESQKVPGQVQVAAADPGAAKYVAANPAKIQGLVKRLAGEGQL